MCVHLSYIFKPPYFLFQASYVEQKSNLKRELPQPLPYTSIFINQDQISKFEYFTGGRKSKTIEVTDLPTLLPTLPGSVFQEGEGVRNPDAVMQSKKEKLRELKFSWKLLEELPGTVKEERKHWGLKKEKRGWRVYRDQKKGIAKYKNKGPRSRILRRSELGAPGCEPGHLSVHSDCVHFQWVSPCHSLTLFRMTPPKTKPKVFSPPHCPQFPQAWSGKGVQLPPTLVALVTGNQTMSGLLGPKAAGRVKRGGH